MGVYQTHPECRPPSDEDTIIWRYMDLPRFVSVLQRRALFFTTIRQLKLRDPYEGVFSVLSKNFPILPTEEEITRFAETGYISPSQTSIRRLLEEVGAWITENFVAVNCWHINGFESTAMWQLYANFNEGIAIQSKYRRLRDCFLDNDKTPRILQGEVVPVSIGEVDYIDYTKDRNKSENIMTVALYKRKSFEHERELRAISLLPWNHDHTKIDVHIPKIVVKDFRNYGGVYFPVDLHCLIEQVFIAPNALGWFKEIISSIMKKYKLNVPLIQSGLLNEVH